MRLRLLSESPQQFGSNYAREVAFTQDIWIKRLENPFIGSWIATTTNQPDASDSTLFDKMSKDERDEHYLGIVGCGGFGLPSSKVATVVSMWVAPHSRNHGVAGDLLDSAITWARNLHDDDGIDTFFSSMYLTVKPDNASAINLYQRKGFKLRPRSDSTSLELEMDMDL